MADEQRDHKEEEDTSMVDALSSLGWIEEKEDEEEIPVSEEDKIREQLNFFIEQNKQLTDEIGKLNEEIESLKTVSDSFHREKEKSIQLAKDNNTTIEDLLQKIVQKDDLIKDLESKIDFLNETSVVDLEVSKKIESKEKEVASLQSQLGDKSKIIQEFDFAAQEKNQIIQDQKNNIENLNKVITEQSQKLEGVSADLEKIMSEQLANAGLLGRLQKKDAKIKELIEQIQYLENDTVQKSKFEKVQLLIEKKDEIITEKEKEIFKIESSQQSNVQLIKELQQKVETFSLVKKDLAKKEERIKNLVIEIEKLTQQNITNKEFIDQIQARLEESQEKSGNTTGKLELEIINLRNVVDEQIAEIKEVREKGENLKNKIYESEQIEDRILTEMQNVKDEKMKLEAELENKDKELVELKKRIKVMRRDIKKS
jgi:chromosome segregation ATPase